MKRFGFSRADVPRASACGVLLLCVLAMPLLSSADTVPALNTVYNFTGADDVAFELSPLLQASDGDLYGVSAYGGQNDLGYADPVPGDVTPDARGANMLP